MRDVYDQDAVPDRFLELLKNLEAGQEQSGANEAAVRTAQEDIKRIPAETEEQPIDSGSHNNNDYEDHAIDYYLRPMDIDSAFGVISRISGIHINDLKELVSGAQTRAAAGEVVNFSPPQQEATRLYDKVRELGFTSEDALQALQGAAAAARETTARAEERSRITATRLRASFEMRVRESDLDNPELDADERRRRAKNLVQTFDRLREVDPTYEDDSGIVPKARSIVNKSSYRPRGRNPIRPKSASI